MLLFLQTAADSVAAAAGTAYDSVWAQGAGGTPAAGFEQMMLAEDKLYVVLAVVLVIWIGLMLFVWRTDRKLDALERTSGDGIMRDAS